MRKLISGGGSPAQSDEISLMTESVTALLFLTEIESFIPWPRDTSTEKLHTVPVASNVATKNSKIIDFVSEI
jgi:hypothetical protein